MDIAVFGTGSVGRTISSKLASLGHQVKLGTRNPAETLGRTGPGPFGMASFQSWAEEHRGIEVVPFREAAAFGEVIFNCTAGLVSLDALQSAGAENLAGKIVIDVANPIDFSSGGPRPMVSAEDSLAERLQRAFPTAHVVKALNTMNAFVMVDPSRVKGPHDVFVAGDDPTSRARVVGFLQEWFGWRAPIDLGDLTAARALEAWLPLWIRLWGALGTGDFNIHVAR
jgi:predicted dinucleotide-binding enzyme